MHSPGRLTIFLGSFKLVVCKLQPYDVFHNTEYLLQVPVVISLISSQNSEPKTKSIIYLWNFIDNGILDIVSDSLNPSVLAHREWIVYYDIVAYICLQVKYEIVTLSVHHHISIGILYRILDLE